MNSPLPLFRSLVTRVPARVWLWAFGAAIALDLVAISLGLQALRWATKPALLLLLLGYFTVRAAPGRRVARWFGLGLLLAWSADIVLLVEGTPAFLTGMALFGLMQIVYIAVFVQLGALEGVRRRWTAPGCYLAFWLGAIVVLWPELGALAAPIAAYGLLLVAMGAIASGLNATAAVGGLLFVISDLVLGLGVAGFDLPLAGQTVMSTYAAAQLLLVLGILRGVYRTDSSGAHGNDTAPAGH